MSSFRHGGGVLPLWRMAVGVLLAAGALMVDAAENDAPAAADERPQTIDELVRTAREGSAQQRARLAEREQRFLEARDERATLLAEIERKRRAAEAEADRLRAAFERGETELAELETMLDERSGDLREVFTVVRQAAGDAQPMVQNSMVSAQLTGRDALVDRLARQDNLPAAADLRGLWLLFLEEMNQSGRVSRFEGTVIGADGVESTRQITRIGTFTALADGRYLRYLPESGRLLALARQPAGLSATDALAFENAESEMQRVGIDPSRGAILSLIVQAPDVGERVQQGGVIGYIIIALGALGLVLGVWRFGAILLAGRSLQKNLASDSADGEQAVAQLRAVSRDQQYLGDADALSAKMDEIVTISSEALRRGLPTLALFAAVSPLLGLLGTVTGMIETFQVITLFGAGDPRLMSGGISQALVTTQLGLSVAIPLLLIHSFVQGRANAQIALLDETAAALFAQARARHEDA